MAVAFSKIKPGMTLLDIHKHKVGNTTMTEWGQWEVKVISVDGEAKTAMCSWNGNSAQLYTEHRFKNLYLKPTKAYLAQEARRAARGGRWM